jgi:phosphoenolpyruvate-protein kinase (PTS system EI component)
VATDIEAHAGRVSGAAGIGLLRTELPFLEFGRWPTEADHRRALRPILAEAAGWPVTLRLLDFANDKIPPFLTGMAAGLDALLSHTDALEAQIRAAVRVGRDTRLRIMVPMVTHPDQVRAVRAVVEAVVADAGAADTPESSGSDTAAPPAKAVPVGAMIETMDAVADIAALCEVCDFLSIGTNDLTAQVLDLDRRDPRALPELTAHPRVLDPVGRVVAAANRAGIPVSVCGDSGAHPTTLPLLLGAGVRHLSVACARVDEVRYRVRRLRVDECAALFTEALPLTDADEVHKLVRLRAETPLP